MKAIQKHLVKDPHRASAIPAPEGTVFIVNNGPGLISVT